jgi:hypothetical protein
MNPRNARQPLIIAAGLVLILAASFLPSSFMPVPEIAGFLSAVLIPAVVIYALYAEVLKWFGGPWTWWKGLREGRWEPGWADWAAIIIVGLFTCGLAYFNRSGNSSLSWQEILHDFGLIAIVILGFVVIFVYRWWSEKKNVGHGFSLSWEPALGEISSYDLEPVDEKILQPEDPLYRPLEKAEADKYLALWCWFAEAGILLFMGIIAFPDNPVVPFGGIPFIALASVYACVFFWIDNRLSHAMKQVDSFNAQVWYDHRGLLMGIIIFSFFFMGMVAVLLTYLAAPVLHDLIPSSTIPWVLGNPYYFIPLAALTPPGFVWLTFRSPE